MKRSAADAIAAADAVARSDVLQALAILETAEIRTPLEKLEVARSRLIFSEWSKRIKLGLAPFHARGPDDMGFPHSPNEYARYRSAVQKNRESAVIDMLCIYFLEGGTNREFYRAARGHVMGTVDFDIDIISEDAAGPPGDPAIWLGYDKRYGVFADPFVRSIRAHGEFDVVTHIFADHPRKHFYYHAWRFVELAKWMDTNNRPVWIMDVDAIANRSPAELFPLLQECDLAVRGRPGRLEPWNQYNASVIGFNNTASGKSYLKTVASFIERAAARNELEWGLDQVALLCCLRACKPKITFLDRQAVNYDHKPDGIIWCNSGLNKWKHLDPNFIDPERQDYLAAFRKFSA